MDASFYMGKIFISNPSDYLVVLVWRVRFMKMNLVLDVDMTKINILMLEHLRTLCYRKYYWIVGFCLLE